MRRVFLLLAACGTSVSGSRPPEGGGSVVMTCKALGSVHLAGSPVSAVVELRNVGADDLALAGMSIPWAYRHAAKFAITSPGPFSSEVSTLADPGDYPAWPLARGQSDRGDLDLTWRFVDGNQKSFVDRPGTYTLVGRARLLTHDGKREIDVACGPFDVVVQPRAGEMGTALDLAEKAARDAKYDLTSYRLTDVERESDGTIRLFFRHVYPAPVGGHFTVYVDPRARTASLRPGE